jgi:creatinine amidohydrolase
MQIDPVASHASWLENFPWTRLAGVTMPAEQKPMMDLGHFSRVDPVAKKALLGDGNYGGLYQRGDDDMMAMWAVAVEETRALMRDGWA